MMSRASKQKLCFQNHVLFTLFFLLAIYTARIKAQGARTDSGYDTVGGEDAICWLTPPFRNQTITTIDAFGEPEVAPIEPTNLPGRPFVNGTFLAGPTVMLSACPLGTEVHMDIVTPAGERMRRFQPYTYHVYGSVNLTELRSLYQLHEEAFFYSDKGPQVVLRFVFCPMNGNLCSPFRLRAKPKANSRLLSLVDDATNDQYVKEEQKHGFMLRRGKIRQRRLQEVEQNNKTRHKGEDPPGLDTSIIISPFSFHEVNFSLSKTFFEFQLDIELAFPYPGTFLPLGIMSFMLDNRRYDGSLASNETLFKFDAANLNHQRAQTFYEPMNIQTVTSGIEILTYVLIAVAALVLVYLLGCTVYYRKEGVMKLSQGSFLMVLLIAGIVATCCSVLYNPESSVNCYLQGPMTLIPLQLMLAIVFGRLRRIEAVMAPLMDWQKPQTSQQTTKRLRLWRREFLFPGSYSSTTMISSSNTEASDAQGSEGETRKEVPRWRKKFQKRQQRTLRQTYSAKRLWLVIVLMTLPMVIVEIVRLTVFGPDLMLNTNMDESVGRFECGTTRDQRFLIASIGILIVTLFLAIYQANRSRKLPGLFNEAESISSALVISLFVMCLGFVVIIVADEPDASPGLPYLFKVLIVCSIALLLSVKLVLPKLRIIWKGEKVVLSKMLAEHKKKNATQVPSGTPPVTGNMYSTTPYSTTSNTLPQEHSHSQSTRNKGDSKYERDNAAARAMASKDGPANSDAETSTELDQKVMAVNETQPVDGNNALTSPTKNKVARFESNEPVSSTTQQEPLVIESGHHPPSELTTGVLRLSKSSSRMNERILSGLQVDRNDWENLKQSIDELHGLLANVEFR